MLIAEACANAALVAGKSIGRVWTPVISSHATDWPPDTTSKTVTPNAGPATGSIAVASTSTQNTWSTRMVEEYLKRYLSFRNKLSSGIKKTSNHVQKGIAKQQPTSDHARDCERYEQERSTILEALRVIDSEIENKAKKDILADLGIFLPSYDYRSVDDWEPRIRHSLISELYMFDYAIKHLRDE